MKKVSISTRTRRAIARRLDAIDRKYGRAAAVSVLNRWLVQKREQAKIARELQNIEQRQQDLKSRAARL